MEASPTGDDQEHITREMRERKPVSWVSPLSSELRQSHGGVATDSIKTAALLMRVPGLDLEHIVVCGVKGKGQGARNINYLSTNGIEYKVNANAHYLLKDQVKHLCFRANGETALKF